MAKTLNATLCKNCAYLELIWSAFSRIWTGCGDILRISPYSVRMRENMDQNNSEYGHFSRSAKVWGLSLSNAWIVVTSQIVFGQYKRI